MEFIQRQEKALLQEAFQAWLSPSSRGSEDSQIFDHVSHVVLTTRLHSTIVREDGRDELPPFSETSSDV